VHAEPRYDYYYTSATCSYFSRSSMSRMPLGGGAPVTYVNATTLHGSTGQFGRTHYTFRYEADTTVSNGKWPYSRTTSNGRKRGHMLGRAEHNSADQPQRRNIMTYSFNETAPISTPHFPGISINSFSAGGGGSTHVYQPF